MFVRHSLLVLGLLALSSTAHAEKISDIANTKHNLSMNWGEGLVADTRTVKATGESQICVFCHTPHGANAAPPAPLWNRKLEGDEGYTASYNMYDSSSMESIKPTAPTNSSKLCLSCHDGVIAIGSVNVLNGSASTIAMSGTTAGSMPDGDLGANSGNTRNIGVDLTNDHPISITYDSALAVNDGELSNPSNSPHVGVRGAGVKPLIPLIPDPLDGNKPKLECVSCHDPHIRDTAGTDIKFLRLNRFQENAGPAVKSGNPTFMEFDENNDIICLACHNKEGWVDSAHANEFVANEAYNDDAANARDFPLTIQVWQAACLNCHDTHTVAGSRRLLREGTDGMPASGEILKPGGGGSAIEETCYQCHSDGLDPYYVLEGSNPSVPDIKSDFQLAIHMPITTAEQLATKEMHDIGNIVDGSSNQVMGAGKDMIESQATLGLGNLNNRHAECTDCHNPHRVTKNRLANTNPSSSDAAGTHDHNLENASEHSNLISGVLRGTWGVEPIYGSTAFSSSPMGFTVKKGVPPSTVGSLDSVAETYVTREYQICLKCHSNYAFDDLNPPELGHSGGTAYGTHGVTHYTNQAMEFQAPVAHMGEGTAFNSGASASQVLTVYRFIKWIRYDSAGTWKWRTEWLPSIGSQNVFDNCDPNVPSAACSCRWCSSPGVTPYTVNPFRPYEANTCGATDVNRYANIGIPGLADSPWDGSIWDGITPPDGQQPTITPYSVMECNVITDSQTNNHRSWHPVMAATGRDTFTRGNMDANNFTPPFNAAVGSQTMYCSDCHGSETGTETVEPMGGEDGNPWGPHGSNKDFLLKGDWIELSTWNPYVASPVDSRLTNNGICLKCHKHNAYMAPHPYNNPDSPYVNPPPMSGFRTAVRQERENCGAVEYKEINLHTAHAQRYNGKLNCNWCHVAVPHGWKNKALLVNLNDVGPEVGLPPGTVIEFPPPSTDPYVSNPPQTYTNGPYYQGAILKVLNFAKSGEWKEEDCGTQTWMNAACSHAP